MKNNDARGVGMKAVEFVKKHGWEKAVEVIKNRPPMNSARYRPSDNKYSSTLSSGQAVCTVQLKRLVESWELVESVGGLEIAKKITFQKRLRNEKATHFIQHPENQKLIQLISRNQKKPESSIEFERFEQAIADVESVGESA